jgi:hypothetical protein
MNYDKLLIYYYHMSRWKSHKADGSCSNKGVKATHLYWNNVKSISVNGRKCGWVYKVVMQYDAVYFCASY